MKAGRLPGLRLELSEADGDAGQWKVLAEGLTCLGQSDNEEEDEQDGLTSLLWSAGVSFLVNTSEAALI